MPAEQRHQTNEVRFLFDPFELNVTKRSLKKADDVISVGGRTFDILVALVDRAGEVVSKAELIAKAWPDVTVEEGSLRVHVSALRKALGDGGFGHRYIANVKGRGYCFVAPVTCQSADDQKASSAAPSSKAITFSNVPAQLLSFGGREELLEKLSALNNRVRLNGKARPRPRQGNLAASSTDLVGQTHAVRQIKQLILAHRVVTLVGPGGIGKSTLAQEVANRLNNRFEGGSWLVELASLSDPALVPSAVARALGLRLGGREITAEAVARAIGERTLLLVVDNCEHILEAAANLIAMATRFCPGVTILATSREFLRIGGEQVYRVPPLEVPPEHSTARDDILQHSAVQLLVARTKALNLDFAPRQTQFALLAEISRRLDGIPLAIELVAARVAALGLDHVAASLDDQLRLLTTGYRTAALRHQTLRATLDWSYGLLSFFEQWLLRNLSIFQGGFSIESATAAFGAEHPASEITEGITRLLTKSLISPHGAEGRWRLLDTTRAYAIEKLDQAGEISSARRRHAKYFCAFVLASSEDVQGAADALVANVQDIDNVRAALDWAFSTSGDDQIGIALTAAYVPVWSHFALIGECRERIEQALKCPAALIDANARYRMRLNAGRAWVILLSRSSCPETLDEWTKALEIAEAFADADFQLRALWGLFIEQVTRGDCRAALRIAERFKTIAQSTDRADVLIGHRLIGTAFHFLGKQAEARPHIERFLAEESALANRRLDAFRFQFDQGVTVRSYQARILWLRGNADKAMQVAADAVRIAQTLDHPASLAIALNNAACPVALLASDLPAAESSARFLLDLSVKHAMESWRVIGQCYVGMLSTKRDADKSHGIGMIRAALSELPENAFHILYAQILASLAEALGLIGEAEQGLAVLDAAFARCDRTGEAWYAPELMRMKGELLLKKGGKQALRAAKDLFFGAVHLAEQQGALAWQLRAAMSLARLELQNDRNLAARQSLQSIYRKFTEGFGTGDLISAKQLLDQPL